MDGGGELTLFHFNDNAPSFEDFGKDDGERRWLADDLGRALGYRNDASFAAVIRRAINACNTAGIDSLDHFERVNILDENGGTVRETRLSRFACYLAAMNADSKKPQVAAAQVYFSLLVDSVFEHHKEAEQVGRVARRGEISEQEKSLGATAKLHGVRDYALFHNAGYRGLYNMNLAELKKKKAGRHLISGSLLDYMGTTELAANLFRITQTDERIRNNGIHGQKNREQAHEMVGKKVRKLMLELSGTAPETLPLQDKITEAKKHIKQAQKRLGNARPAQSND
ncbi:MAG: BRO family protein [Gammaproteobacteria bacterium]